MDFSQFEGMEATGFKSYIEFLLWHYRVVDAFWFIYVGEEFDQHGVFTARMFPKCMR